MCGHHEVHDTWTRIYDEAYSESEAVSGGRSHQNMVPTRIILVLLAADLFAEDMGDYP